MGQNGIAGLVVAQQIEKGKALGSAILEMPHIDVNSRAIEQKTAIAGIDLKKSEEALNFAKTSFELTNTNYKRIHELKKDKFASQKAVGRPASLELG